MKNKRRTITAAERTRRNIKKARERIESRKDLKTKREYEKAMRPTVSTFRRTTPKIGRNTLCPCGSNLKYKRCCLSKEVS